MLLIQNRVHLVGKFSLVIQLSTHYKVELEQVFHLNLQTNILLIAEALWY